MVDNITDLGKARAARAREEDLDPQYHIQEISKYLSKLVDSGQVRAIAFTAVMDNNDVVLDITSPYGQPTTMVMVGAVSVLNSETIARLTRVPRNEDYESRSSDTGSQESEGEPEKDPS